MLTTVPAWVRQDGQTLLKGLSLGDQEAIQDARYAFVAAYEAEALGTPDPTWTGARPRSIQDAKHELCILANLALWLTKPSPLCFSIVIHARQGDAEPRVQQVNRVTEILCHPENVEHRVTAEDFPLARRLHGALAQVSQTSAIITAARAAWAGMLLNSEIVRYALFWIGVEALFGPEDGREITYRLSQRVGLFLGANSTEARNLFRLTKQGYAFRSKIVHGRWPNDPNSTTRMLETETLLRRSMIKILDNRQLTEMFSGRDREAFLDELVFRQ